MKAKTLWIPAVLFSLTACAQATASPEKAAASAPQKQVKVLVLQQEDGSTFKWDSSQNQAELEQALASLPAEKRDKVRKMIEQMKTAGHDHTQVMVHALDGDDVDVNVVTDKVVMHKLVAGKGHEFELIKKLLEKGKFSKEQLQELQKAVDSKF